jgi:hypothetical protein
VKLVDISGRKEEISERKMNELETDSKNKNIRDIYTGTNEYNKACQPRRNLVKDVNGDLLVDTVF